MGSKQHILIAPGLCAVPNSPAAQTSGSVHGSMKRNKSSNGQKYQEAGPAAGDGAQTQCWVGGGGTFSVSGLRLLTTPQLLSLPSEGRNHGQHVPKARAAHRIKPLAFCLVRHRIWGQVLEAKGLCESWLSYLTSCPTLQKHPLCGFFIC